jgi:hypothetical protein
MRSCSNSRPTRSALPETRMSPPGPCLSLALGGDVSRDHPRVVPRRLGQRVRHDVLRERVDPFAEEDVGRERPERRPDLVGHSAQQESIDLEELLGGVLLHVPTGQGQSPGVPSVAVLLVPRCLDDPIERLELCDQDPSHRAGPPRYIRPGSTGDDRSVSQSSSRDTQEAPSLDG